MGGFRRNRSQFACLCLWATVCGCALQRDRWPAPELAAQGSGDVEGHCPRSAEVAYAAAMEAEDDGAEVCVEYYYEAATSSRRAIERHLAERGFASPRTMDLHRSAVTKLLVNAQRFGRWYPGAGIAVFTTAGQTIVPIRLHGFVWQPSDFQQLEPVGDYDEEILSRRYRSIGMGVPLVVSRRTLCPAPFTRSNQAFAATAVMRTCASNGCLDFYNPLNCSTTTVGPYRVAIVRDISAPFAFANRGDDRTWINNFLDPDTDGSQNRLFMLEPYQRGKIPVVFVHGLLSDPKTWADAVNDLRANHDLNERYQWWAYEYETGGPFLEGAAGLRRQLAQIRCTYDPQRTDPAMSKMVLIGHSMGGLICKLQVTESGNRLWGSVADQPLSSVVTTNEVRQRLCNNFFFSPSCDVSRVVYIGTPHQGSPWARRPVGRLASAMVQPSDQSRAAFEQLVRDNPGLLRGVDTDRFPTSIDLLESESPLLRATTTLPYSRRVTVHSIVGVSRSEWNGEMSDGVVPVASAQLYGVRTERQIHSKHSLLHRDPSSVEEIACILRDHAR